ncbi:MAG: PP2C family protein-serine/threonine phosphatase [Phycisphaerales bacterium]
MTTKVYRDPKPTVLLTIQLQTMAEEVASHSPESQSSGDERRPEVVPADPSLEPSDAEKLEMVAKVLELLPEFFYVHDHEMRFRYCNAHVARYFGFQRAEDLWGRRLEDVDRRPGQGAYFSEVCRKVMAEGVPRITDNLPYIRPDGTPGFLRQHDIPFIHPRTGRPLLMGLSRDVTAERQLEDQRLRAAALERELRIAREIQDSLRPVGQPNTPGLSVASYAEPAAYAGGDFFDWAMCPDGRLLLGLGDVTGHGVGPALLASACRAYVRAMVMVHPLPEAMKQINELMCRDAGDGRFVTFALASVAPDTGHVELLSAGQGPIFTIDPAAPAGRRVTSHAPNMIPLGVISDRDAAPTPAMNLTIAPRGALVMVSDGVFEAHARDGTMLGLPRLTALLDACAGLGSEIIVQRIVALVRDHAGGTPLADDVTVLAVARGDPAA